MNLLLNLEKMSTDERCEEEEKQMKNEQEQTREDEAHQQLNHLRAAKKDERSQRR